MDPSNPNNPSGPPIPATDPGLSSGLGAAPSFNSPADPQAPVFPADSMQTPSPQPLAENTAPSWAASEGAAATPAFGQTTAPAPAAEPTPTFMPPAETPGAQGSIVGGASTEETANPFAGASPLGASNEVGGLDTAPTDLSHLAGSSGGEEVSSGMPIPPTVPPEALTVPSPIANTAGSKEVVTSGGVGFPKWIILVGVLVLLTVGAGSAYFILGIGKPVSQAPVEVPAVDNGTSAGTFVPTEENSSEATSSQVNIELTTPTPSNVTPTGSSTATNSSALELLKKRRGQ